MLEWEAAFCSSVAISILFSCQVTGWPFRLVDAWMTGRNVPLFGSLVALPSSTSPRVLVITKSKGTSVQKFDNVKQAFIRGGNVHRVPLGSH